MPNLSKRETATILAALRDFQANGADGGEIASNCGTVTPLTIEEINVLCERLNFDDSEARQTEIVAMLTEVTGALASVRTDLRRTAGADVFALQRMEWAKDAQALAFKANALLEKIDATP